MQVVSLQAGQAYAEWVPARGGMLTDLHLAAEGALAHGVQPLLWQPHPEFYLEHEGQWLHGGMPVLFPFAGRVWWEGQEGYYRAGDKVYPMPIHGFAHNTPWDVESIGERRLCLALESERATLSYFPWHFHVRVHYELSLTSLKCRLDVKNRGWAGGGALEPPMPMACGFHPYFYLPAQHDLRRQSNLDFVSHAVQLVTRQGAGGLIKAGSPLRTHFLHERSLHNLILRNVQGNQVGLYRPHDHHNIQVKIHPADDCYFVLWSRRNQDFFCVEPWMALPNAVHSGEGLRQIPKGESCHFSFEISLKSSAARFAGRITQQRAPQPL